MKKIIYFVAVITTFLIVSGSLFKIMHWPSAAVMIILGSFSFAFLFIPLIILKKFKEESFLKDQIIYSLGIILGTVLGLGFIFKISLALVLQETIVTLQLKSEKYLKIFFLIP